MPRRVVGRAALVAVVLFGASAVSRAGGKAMDGVINLNTAPPATLGLLPGIGPSKVQGIIEYRRRRPFRTVDELVRIKGISSKMVRLLRPHLAATGPTTARLLTAREVKTALEAAAAAPPPPPQKKLAVAVNPPVPKLLAAKPLRRREQTSRANLCLPRR